MAVGLRLAASILAAPRVWSYDLLLLAVALALLGRRAWEAAVVCGLALGAFLRDAGSPAALRHLECVALARTVAVV